MNQKGISGRSFLLLALLTLGSIFFFSVMFSGELGQLQQAWPRMVQEIVAKLVLLATFTYTLLFIIFAIVLDAPIGEWRKLFTDRSNNSYITLLTFIFLTGVFWLMGGSGADFSAYLLVLLWKGAASLLISVLMIFLLAIFIGITSMDELRDEIRAPQTNSYAIFVGGMLAGMMFLIMNI